MPLLDHLGLILSPAEAPAQGDLIVRGVSGGWTTLPLGVPNEVLQSDPVTGLPVWSSQPISGVTGPPGAPGPPGIGGTPKGLYNGATAYSFNDEVLASDSNWYISITAGTNTNTGHDPTTDGNVHWAKISAFLPLGWVGAKSNFSAKGDGVVDDTAAIQNMLNYLKTNGGTGYFEPGTYKITSTLNGDSNTAGYSLIGAGGGNNVNQISKLNFTQAGAVHGLTLNSTFGLEISFLMFEYTVLTGNVVMSDGGVHGPDSQYSSLHHCAFGGPTVPTANAALMLNKTNVWNVHDNYVTKGLYGIQMGPRYVNVCTIGPNNLFYHNTISAIYINSDDCEACTITGNTFEGGSTPYGIKGSPTVFAANSTGMVDLTISYNWFGDLGVSGSWIYQLITWSNNKTINIIGNYFAQCDSGVIHGMKGTWLVMGNTFDASPAFANDSAADWNTLKLTTIANSVQAPMFSAADTNRPTRLVDLGDQLANTTSLNLRLALAKGGGLPGTLDITGNLGEFFVIGGQAFGTLPVGSAKAVVAYVGTSPNPKLVLQAPWDGAQGSVQLVCGATPTPLVSAKDGTKLGFYTKAAPGNEVVQAARAGQLTDSTGGSVTTTLAAGITDAVAKNAIASLAAKVNALETIIHNLGLSA